ncbi:MFS transporter [Sporosarcina gallistercoris]|uniref:MFS transporter n=1 Tax=Sporosarcina gallistercoris TaxID=2762245 RepID=A0ABR8PNB7_9BACL|nr:MFS transporter [Sporosarcina gallistercoris]MBD7909644.1 MFS transporter [Sporosarcina gallistercoris]
MEDKQNLWTKDFIFISIINFFIMIVMYMLIVTIAPFAVDEYGASASMAGLVSGIFIIGTLSARIATGRVIESMGSRRILLIGMVISVLAIALYFTAHSLPVLLLVRFVHGIGLGVASTATGTMVAQIIPPSRRGEGIGYFSLSSVLATAIGPFFGIYLSQHVEFNWIFIFSLALGMIGFLMFFFVDKRPEEAPQKVVERKDAPKGIANYIEKSAIPIAVITLLAGIGYSGVLSFLSFYAKEAKVVDAASFFFLVYAIAILVSRPFSGKLLDRKGGTFVVVPSLILFACGLLLLSQTHTGVILLVAGAIIGLGFGNFQSCAQAIALIGVPIKRIGIATSTFYIFLDFGFGFGPYFLGNVATAYGYRDLYMILSGLIVVALLLYLLIARKKQPVLQ